jgi:hypothetical protein
VSRGEARTAGSPSPRRVSTLAMVAGFLVTVPLAVFVPALALATGAVMLLALVVARARGESPPLLRGLAFGCWGALVAYVALALVNALFGAPGSGTGGS